MVNENFGAGIMGGVYLLDPATGQPYRASGGTAGSVAWADVTGKPTTFDPVVGTTAGTAAEGNDARLSDSRTPTAHTHPVSQVSDSTTIGQAVITATDAAAARAAIGAQAAGSYGGVYPVVWDSITSAYPSTPATPPDGVLIREFVGPVNPSTLSIAAWAGVVDLYTYATI
jgi:hypothetical protein